MNRYEYALLRYVHDPVAGEFANVGVALLDRDARRLHVMSTDRYGRFSDFFRGLDGQAFRGMVRAVERALLEVDRRLEQGDMVRPVPERLDAILQTVFPDADSALQVSAVMGGVHQEPAQRLQELYDEFVGRYEASIGRAKRTEDFVRRDFNDRVSKSGLLDRLQFDVPINAAHYSYHFHTGWANGRPQVMEPISFDLERGPSIVEKAIDWSGRLHNLAHGSSFGFTALIAPPADRSLAKDYRQALAILRDTPTVREVIEEADAGELLRIIREDTDPHFQNR